MQYWYDKFTATHSLATYADQIKYGISFFCNTLKAFSLTTQP